MDIATINVVEESEAAPLLAAKKRTTCRSRRDTGATKKSTARQSNKGKVGFQSSTEETSDEGASTSNRMLHVPERRESEQTPYLIFRAIIHTAVAAWPLTFAIFGLACFLDCPANPLLPLMNFMAGLLGSATVVLRLIYFMWKHLLDADLDHKFQISILGLDLTFFVSFIMYNYFLFNLEPSYDSHSENYCNYSFYNFNYKCNFASIAFLVLYAFWKMLSVVKLWISSRRI